MQFPAGYFGVYPAFVAIYHGDGTVAVSHGGVECGQGINTKVAQVVAYGLGIPLELVNIKQADTLIGANSTVTGGSVTSECVCFAAKRVCDVLVKRLKAVRDTLPPNAKWLEVVQAAFARGIDLTAKYMMKPTDAKPYFVYGCACAELEVDVLTGNLLINRVDIVEDVGQSMSPLVDVGQIEGAFMMGVGYWLNEKLVYDRRTGQLLTDRSWNYKVPGAKDIPIDFRVKFIASENEGSLGVLRSKTTGEPALVMSIVVSFALRHALNSARAESGIADSWYHLGMCQMQINFSINDYTIY